MKIQFCTNECTRGYWVPVLGDRVHKGLLGLTPGDLPGAILGSRPRGLPGTIRFQSWGIKIYNVL